MHESFLEGTQEAPHLAPSANWGSSISFGDIEIFEEPAGSIMSIVATRLPARSSAQFADSIVHNVHRSASRWYVTPLKSRESSGAQAMFWNVFLLSMVRVSS